MAGPLQPGYVPRVLRRTEDGVWTLHKRKHTAECSLWTHPIGGEIRLEAAGDFVRSEAGRDGMALIDLAMQWRQQFIEKGLTA